MGNLSINNGGIETNKEGMASIDSRYGPYASVAAAHAALNADGVCAIGLTVGIISGNNITEYWYQGGTAQTNLVEKQQGGGGGGSSDSYTKTESDNRYQQKESGKGLSTNDYSTADKNKLGGLPTGTQLSTNYAQKSDYYNKDQIDQIIQGVGDDIKYAANVEAVSVPYNQGNPTAPYNYSKGEIFVVVESGNGGLNSVENPRHYYVAMDDGNRGDDLTSQMLFEATYSGAYAVQMSLIYSGVITYADMEVCEGIIDELT